MCLWLVSGLNKIVSESVKKTKKSCINSSYGTPKFFDFAISYLLAYSLLNRSNGSKGGGLMVNQLDITKAEVSTS